jgi:hypothetical protein
MTSNRAPIGLCLSLILPSAWVAQKYLGLCGAASYAVLASAILFLGHRYLFEPLAARMTNARAVFLAVATFALLIACFALVHPVADGAVPGRGSDRDDALNMATWALLKGHFPYYGRTYLGSYLTPMPGALMLAAPFVVLGDSAWQSFFWLFAFLLVARRTTGDLGRSLILLWVCLSLSPGVLHELVTGGDLLANGIYVLVFIVLLFEAVAAPSPRAWKKAGAAVLLGIGLSSRANFALVLPLVFSALARTAGWRAAAGYLAVTCATLASITLPFYLYDPASFTPLWSAGELGAFDATLPHAEVVIPLAAGAVALALSFRRGNGRLPVLLAHCAAGLAVPVLAGAALEIIEARRIELGFLGFGLCFTFFGALAFWSVMHEKGKAKAWG